MDRGLCGRSFGRMLPSHLLKHPIQIAASLFVATAIIFMGVAATDASAATGTLSVKLDGAPRKAKKAKRTTTLRVIDLRTGQIAQSSSLRKTSTKLKLQPGAYVVSLRTIDVPGIATEGTSKIALVKANRSTKQTLRAKPLRKAKKKRKKKSKKASVSASIPNKYFAPASETADRLVAGIDPKIAIKGFDEYPNGLEIDSVLATPLSKGCPGGQPKFTLVEIRRRAEIIEEIKRGSDPRFDKSTTVKIGGLWRETAMVRGSGSVSGGVLTIQLSLVDVTSGQVIASGLASGSEKDWANVIDAVADKLLENICGAKVDVTFTGSGNYRRDEVSSDGDNEDHITADFNWSTTYRGVPLDVDGNLKFSEASVVDGHWNTAGRYGAVGPGSYNCSAPVIGNNGDFAMLRIYRPGGHVKLVVDPYMAIMGDYENTSCTGLPGPPYAAFTMFGGVAANQATVEFTIADLSAGPIVRAVSPTAVLAPDCADLVGGYETPCTQSSGWSGTVTVTRSE